MHRKAAEHSIRHHLRVEDTETLRAILAKAEKSLIVILFLKNTFESIAKAIFTGGGNSFLDLKYINNSDKETFYIEDITYIYPQSVHSNNPYKSDLLYYEENINTLDKKYFI